MKVIAINGSARKNGNTAQLLNNALRGAADQGAETELIHLYGLNFRGCSSCFSCKLKGGNHGTCAMKDDLTPVLEAIKEADGLILGSPNYYTNISSSMQALLERLLFSNVIYSNEIPTVFPKPLPNGFIYNMNVPKEQYEMMGLGNHYQMMLMSLMMVLRQKPMTLYSYNTYQFSDYSKYEHSMFSESQKAAYKEAQFPKDCEAAYEMGKKIAQKAAALKK